MTSDAKIGLLLGLVFIFVIAFIINGLPNLRPQSSKAEVTPNMVPLNGDDFAGVTGNAQGAVDWSTLLEQPPAGGQTVPAVIEEPKPVAQSTPQTPTAGTGGIRSVINIANLLEHFTPTVQKERDTTVDLGGLASTSEPPAAVGPQAGWGPRPESATGPQPAEAVAKLPEPRETPKPTVTGVAPTNVSASRDPSARPSAPMSVPVGKIYVAVDGDNLATIAKKMYGPEEGNRVANIQRIFHANEALLKSPDNVLAGQKLMIPPPLPKLSTPSATVPTPASVLPKDLFEKPKTISERLESLKRPVAPAPAPAPAQEGRWYTVQDGDSLWKIAATQLGSGARCEEIAKLNADILQNKDTIDPGMKLRLPAQ